MSWLFSRALVEAFSEASCSDGEPSAPLSGNPTQLAYLPPDRMTDFSRLSRFGMTYKPLTEDRGEELLTLFRAGFHAKTLAHKEKEMAWTVSDQECGDTWRGWLAKYDPDTSSWKTAQCSLLEEEQESLATLPKWGMTVNGLLWERPMLEPITRETEFGLWATPTRCDYKGCTGTANFQSRKKQFQDLTGGQVTGTIYPNPTTYEAMMGWPLGWTDLKPLVTDKCRSALQRHGKF